MEDKRQRGEREGGEGRKTEREGVRLEETRRKPWIDPEGTIGKQRREARLKLKSISLG